MTHQRWDELMDLDLDGQLTIAEINEGWHWCNEFDGLLVKGDPDSEYCGQACIACDLSRELT